MGAGHGLDRAVDRNIPAVVDDSAVDHTADVRGSALFDDDVPVHRPVKAEVDALRDDHVALEEAVEGNVAGEHLAPNVVAPDTFHRSAPHISFGCALCGERL